MVSGESNIYLTDGTVVHATGGTVVTPGSKVTVMLSDGQVRSIPWTDVARIEAAAATTPPPSQPTPPMTLVHLSGDLKGELLTQDALGSEGEWHAVCSGACDQALPTNALYRLGGPGVRKSKPFQLHGDREWLEVSTASSLGFAGGLTLLIIGGGSLVTGVTYAVLGAVINSGFGSPDQGYMVAGGVLIGIGVLNLVIGIPLFGSNVRTVIKPAQETHAIPPPTDSVRESRIPPFQGAMIGVPFRF